MDKYKLYVFKVYTKSDNKLVIKSENIKACMIPDYVDRFYSYFLHDLMYYKIEEIGQVSYL